MRNEHDLSFSFIVSATTPTTTERGCSVDGSCLSCVEECRPVDDESSLCTDTDTREFDCVGVRESMVESGEDSSVTEDIGAFREIDRSNMAQEMCGETREGEVGNRNG